MAEPQAPLSFRVCLLHISASAPLRPICQPESHQRSDKLTQSHVWGVWTEHLCFVLFLLLLFFLLLQWTAPCNDVHVSRKNCPQPQSQLGALNRSHMSRSYRGACMHTCRFCGTWPQKILVGIRRLDGSCLWVQNESGQKNMIKYIYSSSLKETCISHDHVPLQAEVL